MERVKVYLRLGELDDARDAFSGAAQHFSDVGDPAATNIAQLSLAGILIAKRRHDEAIGILKDVVASAARIGQVDLQARAHSSLGEACMALEEPLGSLHHFETASRLFDSIESPAKALSAKREGEPLTSCQGGF